MGENEDYKAGLRHWITSSDKPGMIGHDGIELKARGRTFKSVAFNFYGNNPEEPSRRELEFAEVPSKPADWGYDFKNPISRFTLTGEEIDVLHRFMNGKFAEQGFYIRTDSKDLARVLSERLRSDDGGAEALSDLLKSLGDDAELIRAVANSSHAGHLAALIDQERRRAAIEELEHLANSPDAAEKDFQKLVEVNPWIFGGKFVGIAQRRSLTVLDQLDIPLINSDGSLHIVELKTAAIPKLYRMHRNHWIVGNDVHEAVAQTENYLHSLDTQAANIKMSLNLEVQRAFATVVVGHIAHCDKDITDDQASLALRIYNSHLSRVRVMTYDQLIANAKNAMVLGVSGSGDGV